MTNKANEKREKPKLIIFGDKLVGKSSLRNYLLGRPIRSGRHRDHSVSDVIETEMDDGTVVEMYDFHDIDTIRENKTLQRKYLSNTTGLLLMFAINDRSSFESIPELFTMVINNNKRKLIPLAIVGNKNDLRQKGEEFVTFKEAAEYSRRISEWANIEIPYYDVSLKFETGIDPIIEFVKNPLIIHLKT